MHEDLHEGIGPNYRVVDGIEYPERFTPYTSPQISNGGDHGTDVAGIIGADMNNNIGIASCAGGWDPFDYQGVSLLNLKVNNRTTNLLTEAWIDAVADGTYQYGLAAKIVNFSASNFPNTFSKALREAISYGYNLGVSSFASKGKSNSARFNFPADNDYHQVCAVGGYRVEKYTWLQPPTLVDIFFPAKSYNSDFGFGLDILAFAKTTKEVINAITLEDGGGYHNVDGNSIACEQVTGLAALILSTFEDNNNSEFKEQPSGNPIPFLPHEDVEGLINISGLDLEFEYAEQGGTTEVDTSGYDTRTGYGFIKAGETLQNMQNPYSLYHYEYEPNGDVNWNGFIYMDDFIVSLPLRGSDFILPPTVKGVREYKATLNKIQGSIELTGWDKARSWGRGGNGTLGWSGSQPILEDGNSNQDNIQNGWCKVIGEGNENTDNIKDISFRNDQITLQTFCYKVFNKFNNNFIGRYPCEPDEVIYQYTIWGKNSTSSVKNYSINEGEIKINIENINLLGLDYLRVLYTLPTPAPVTFTIADLNGKIFSQINQETWSGKQENQKSINIENLTSGLYILSITDGKNISSIKFIVE